MPKRHKQHVEVQRDSLEWTPKGVEAKEAPSKKPQPQVNLHLDINEFDWTEKQKQLIQLIEDKHTKIVFIRGVAGTSKTLIAVYCMLNMIKASRVSKGLFLRQPVESTEHKLGYLPSDLDAKLKPYAQPLVDKMHELLDSSSDINKLLKSKVIDVNTIGYLRGLSWNETFVIGEECQNYTTKDFLLICSRLGRYSKLVFCGDASQSDIKNSGFSKVFNLFDTAQSKERGIATFEFGKEDCMRSEVLSYILDRFEELNKHEKGQ